MNMQRWLISGAISLGISLGATPGFADTGDGACSGLPSHSALQGALSAAVGPGNGGLGFNMWASIVTNDDCRIGAAEDVAEKARGQARASAPSEPAPQAFSATRPQ